MSEYKQLFLSEAEEILGSLNNVLVELEKEPASVALLNELFRGSHTLKSMAQSMGYENITGLTHSMESALSLLRTGKLKAEKSTVDLLFKSLDALGSLVEEVRKGKAKGGKVSSLVKRFEEIASAVAGGEQKSTGGKQAEEISTQTHSGGVKTVRVPLSQLDNLMDVVGELSINKITLSEIAQATENESLDEAVTQMSRLTSELQNQTMQIRLVPLEYILTPYPRMVRDMAAKEKKEVDLVIEGGNIGLDRTIQDEINEPLLHLLKNAVAHGIEEPKEREGAKKPRRGKIELLARREKDCVVIELSDDGRGINTEEVRETAIKRGIITEEEISNLTSEEILMIVTSSGYSGAKDVTEAAGRGVGMNAVRTKVESFGGTLDIGTTPKAGTTFSIRLPLTMAIVQAMLVGVAEETYCIPLSHIAETIQVPSEEIKAVERHEVISYRDMVLPLIRLRETLGFPASGKESQTPEMEHTIPRIPVVVTEVGARKAGLVVDRLLGQQEVVIKPLSGILRRVKGVSGATILGGGEVALIVDVPSLLVTGS